MFSILRDNKNLLRIAILTCIVLLVLLPLQYTHAADSGGLLGSIGQGIMDGIKEVIYFFALTIGGFFLTIGASFLDGTIYYLIVRMGEWFGPGEDNLGAAVNLGWTLIRDLLNMCFIFGLIYIGIKTILNSNDSRTRRALGYLIAAALLINFSLYITQLLVDFTNVLATQVYAQIAGSSSLQNDVLASMTTPIAEAFLSAAGFSTILDPSAALKITDFDFGTALMYSVMIMIFFIVAGIAFFLGAIMVVTRFVALLLYMIFSPLMFIGWILPQFSNLASIWWKGFFKYSFFAPIYLFLIYISINMLQGLVGAMTKGSGYSSLSGGVSDTTLTVGFVQMVMFFMIMIGMLWGSLKVGNKMSISGANLAMNGFNRVGGAMTAGLAARGLRGTVGYAANRVAESESAQRWARSGSVLGRQFMRTADATRNASFDARNTKALGSAGLGKGQKGGYVQRQKDLVKREQNMAKLIGTEDTRLYADAGVMDMHNAQKNYDSERSKLNAELSQTNDPAKRQRLVANIAALDSVHEQRKKSEEYKVYEKIKKNMKKEVQNQFADGLSQQQAVFTSTMDAYKEAADSIRKETNKSKSDAAFDTLKEEMTKALKDKD